MAKLSDEETKLLEKLRAKAEAPDAEDYEIRIRNEHGHEATVPASRGAGWVKQNFGIDLFDQAGDEGEEGTGEEDEGEEEGGKGYFKGRRKGA